MCQLWEDIRILLVAHGFHEHTSAADSCFPNNNIHAHPYPYKIP